MRHDVAAVVGPDGWTTWNRLTDRLSPGTVRAWVASGRLVRIDEGLYATPEVARDWRLRLGAVLRRRNAVASHTTALSVWGLLPAPDGPFHVTVAGRRSGRGNEGLVLHRGRDVDWHIRRVGALTVTSVERALVDAWADAEVAGRSVLRGAAITAVRQRLCGAADLAAELRIRRSFAGRAALNELAGLLTAGCRSELEIWGCLEVLRAPGMPPFVQQQPVLVAGKRHVLDAAYLDALLAVEMDGAAYHGSREQREGDIRRDALLATAGWQTLRFSYARLTREPGACRAEIMAVHSARVRLLAAGRGREVRVSGR